MAFLSKIWGKPKRREFTGQESPPAPAEPNATNGRGPTPRPLFAESAVEPLTQAIGRDLLQQARADHQRRLSSQSGLDQLMAWTLQDSAFKVQLFRFVDVFPMLVGQDGDCSSPPADQESHRRSPDLVYAYLLDYLRQPGVKLPPGLDLGLRAGVVAKGLFAKTVASQIKAMGANFIAGADSQSALPKLRRRWEIGIASTVPLLGEVCVSNAEARTYQQRYLDLIQTLPEALAQWPANPRLESDHLGAVPRANVSVKISALDPRVDPIDAEGSLRRLQESLRPLLEAAAERNVLVNFDMEQYALKDLTLELFQRCCEQIAFPAGLALQAYLRSGPADAERIIRWTKRTGRQVTVRLIKGAYWDYEVIRAEQLGWPVPVWTTKSDTDACFEHMAEQLVAAIPRRAAEGGTKLAIGSHNIRSIARVLALLSQYDLPRSAVEIQMLFGMADQLKQTVFERGLRLHEYVPIGQLIPGMAYLVRRLLENTSNQSWLRAGFFGGTPDDDLLQPPHPTAQYTSLSLRETSGVRGTEPAASLDDRHPFSNEPQRDFSQPDQRKCFAAAVRDARVPAVAPAASADDAVQAVARAESALFGWRDTDPRARSTCLVKAAVAMRARRDELAGIMIREAGKTWREADADICEAIDFCEYYARAAISLFQARRLGQFVGEWNETWHQPRGVAVVISPWNFPSAIFTGMTTAALVTGNPTIAKPATQTPGIAQAVCETLWQAGVPRDVLQLLPGPGSVLGAALVRDPRVALIAFTGSKQVGLEILEAAAQTPAGQDHLKKVVCEMGGKNAVIVDESADLDEAVLAVRQSAFAYSGQKCSAASRVIVVDRVYRVFLQRLLEATQSLVIGNPLDPGTDIGPVIDDNAARKIRQYIDIGKNEGRLELACPVPPGLEETVGKPYIGPHIFSGIGREHRLFHEEIFGPVLSVVRAADFSEALTLANAVSYKLTGGVFSRKPSHLEAAKQQFRVGNLYLNRGITGALVGRQPFGGFGLSGTGTQAGGPEYLLHFVEPRVVTENTMRHGFAPGLEK